jgi:hypothetical protein
MATAKFVYIIHNTHSILRLIIHSPRPSTSARPQFGGYRDTHDSDESSLYSYVSGFSGAGDDEGKRHSLVSMSARVMLMHYISRSSTSF